jgi:hypothetical protein
MSTKSTTVRMSTPAVPSKSGTVRMSSGQQNCSTARVVGNSRKRSSDLTTSTETSQVSLHSFKNAQNLKAQLPLSQASSSVTVHISSGSASAKVSAQEPSKRKKKTLAKFQQYLMLPPTAGATSSSGSGRKI